MGISPSQNLMNPFPMKKCGGVHFTLCWRGEGNVVRKYSQNHCQLFVINCTWILRLYYEVIFDDPLGKWSEQIYWISHRHGISISYTKTECPIISFSCLNSPLWSNHLLKSCWGRLEGNIRVSLQKGNTFDNSLYGVRLGIQQYHILFKTLYGK